MAFEKAITIVIILSCVHCGDAQLSTPINTWTTNCFTDTQSGRCEDSSIKICSDYYLCDLVTETRAPPKRIGYINGNILAAVGPQTFIIRNGSVEEMSERVLIPPWDEFDDNRGNIYYAADGTTYMAEKDTKKEIEIITTGENSFNQLVFNKETDQLFILSFSANSETNERSGSLFAINTDKLNIENDRVQAERVTEVGDDITAMAVEEGLDRLLLGLKTSHGGKVIRLAKQKGNPCSTSSAGIAAIQDIFKEAQEKLIEIFENMTVAPAPRTPLFAGVGLTSSRSLELENIRLKRELHITASKLTSFTSKLFTFNRNLKYIQFRETATTSERSMTSVQDLNPLPGPPGKDGNRLPNLMGPNYSGCASSNLINRLNQRLIESERINDNLKTRLAGLISVVDDILVDEKEEENTTIY